MTAPCTASSRQLTSHHQQVESEGDERAESKGVCVRVCMYACIVMKEGKHVHISAYMRRNEGEKQRNNCLLKP